MFDIHTHIIYQIDDGSRSLDESVRLIRMAMEQGADRFIATPHYYVDKPSNPDEIREKLAQLKERVGREGLPCSIYSGNEVLYFDSILERLKRREVLTLADSSFILLEFYPQESYQTILQAVRKLRGGGYRPVIAHAERFDALRQNGLSEVIEQGAYIQLSTQPIGGFALNEYTRFCRKALKNGEVHFLGTDMHRADTRPPVLENAVKWVKKHIGNAEAVLNTNAQCILRDAEPGSLA